MTCDCEKKYGVPPGAHIEGCTVESSTPLLDLLARTKAREDGLVTRVERLERALREIAETYPRPLLDPHNCEERLRKMARAALNPKASTSKHKT